MRLQRVTLYLFLIFIWFKRNCAQIDETKKEHPNDDFTNEDLLKNNLIINESFTLAAKEDLDDLQLNQIKKESADDKSILKEPLKSTYSVLSKSISRAVKNEREIKMYSLCSV